MSSVGKGNKGGVFAPLKGEVNAHQELDPYRALPGSFKKPLLEFSAANPFPTVLPSPASCSLLKIKPQHYNGRLANKSLILQDPPLSGPASQEAERKQHAVNKGKKRRALATKEEVEKLDKDDERGLKRKRIGLGNRKENRKAWDLEAGVKISYNLLLPLHYLYLSYLSELLSLPSYQEDLVSRQASTSSSTAGHGPLPASRLPNGLGCELISARIVKSDMTGAILRVKRSKNEALHGLEGLVVQETAGTFKIVPKDGIVRVIPKGNTLFLLSFPAYSFQTLPHVPNAGLELQETLPPLEPIDPSDPLAFLTEPVSTDSILSTASNRHQAFETSLARIPRIEIDILGSAFAFRSEDRAGRKFKPGTVLDQGWAADWLLPEMFDQ